MPVGPCAECVAVMGDRLPCDSVFFRRFLRVVSVGVKYRTFDLHRDFLDFRLASGKDPTCTLARTLFLGSSPLRAKLMRTGQGVRSLDLFASIQYWRPGRHRFQPGGRIVSRKREPVRIAQRECRLHRHRMKTRKARKRIVDIAFVVFDCIMGRIAASAAHEAMCAGTGSALPATTATHRRAGQHPGQLATAGAAEQSQQPSANQQATGDSH